MRKFEVCFQKKQQQQLRSLLLFGSNDFRIILSANWTDTGFHYEIANGWDDVGRNRQHASLG